MAESTILATFVGGGIAIASSFGLEYFKATRDSRALALSFEGSTQAIIDIVEARKYRQWIATLIAEIDEGKGAVIFKISASREYTEIYRSNVGKIGSLRGELPALIARFYIVTNSILEDVDALNRGDWDGQEPQVVRILYTGMLDLLAELCRINDRIRDQVAQHYQATARWQRWIISFRYR